MLDGDLWKAASVQTVGPTFYVTGIVDAEESKQNYYNVRSRIDTRTGRVVTANCDCTGGGGQVCKLSCIY